MCDYAKRAQNNGKIAVYDRAGELRTSAWAFHTARITAVEWTQDSQVAMTTSLWVVHCAVRVLPDLQHNSDTNVYFYSVEKPSRNLALKVGVVIDRDVANSNTQNVAAGGVVGGVWTRDAQSIAVAGADGNVRAYDVNVSGLLK